MTLRRGTATLPVAVLLASVVLASVVLSVVACTAATRPAVAAGGSWDPRVEPIARKVAKLRKLEFEHPVPVVFLPSDEFDKKVTVDTAKLTAADKKASAQQTARLAAVGLVPHSSDLVEQQNQLQSSSVLAMYLPDKQKVFVRGDSLDSPAKRVTVAHELTHALQDQHFDLRKLSREAAKTHSVDAYKAVVEGDAVRVQELFAKTLSSADQEAYANEEFSGVQQADAESTAADVAPALEAFLTAPYTFGPPMLQTVQAARNEAAIDGLFRDPPTNDLSYVLPTSLVDGTKVATVAAPAVRGKDERQLGRDDTFGAYALYLVLSQVLDPVDALRIVDGWGGDAMVDYTTGTGADRQQCVRVAFRGQTPAGTKAIAGGLQEWVRAQPAGSASVRNADGKVLFSSCDVAGARPAARNPDLALALLATRAQLIGSYMEQGATTKVARCAADGVVRDDTIRPVLEQTVADPSAQPDDATQAAVQGRVEAIVTGCLRR